MMYVNPRTHMLMHMCYHGYEMTYKYRPYMASTDERISFSSNFNLKSYRLSNSPLVGLLCFQTWKRTRVPQMNCTNQANAPEFDCELTPESFDDSVVASVVS